MGHIHASKRCQLHERFSEWFATELKMMSLLILRYMYPANGDEAEAL